MIFTEIRSLYRSQLQDIIKEHDIQDIDGLLTLISSTYTDEHRSEYVVKNRYHRASETTVAQRLNALWVYPVYILLAPFRFVLYGTPKIDEESRLGHIITYLIGEIH